MYMYIGNVDRFSPVLYRKNYQVSTIHKTNHGLSSIVVSTTATCNLGFKAWYFRRDIEKMGVK